MSKLSKNDAMMKELDSEAICRDIAAVLNGHGVDNNYNIPDYILARYLIRCLNNLALAGGELEEHNRK